MNERKRHSDRIRRVTVRYGSTLAADSVGLAVEKGSVYALLVRNGAGKTSLIRCLLGQRKAQAGTIALFGADPWKRRAHLMAASAWCPKSPTRPPA